jgi:hypothetical protein
VKSDVVRLFQTLPHACGYYAGRTAQNLVIDPAAPQIDRLYGAALERGFRRAGGHLYLPHCPQCRACTPSRVDVGKFAPDRSQRRCLRRNADLAVRECDAGYTDERHALYERYLRSRHPGGGMDEGDAGDFGRLSAIFTSLGIFGGYLIGVRLLGVDGGAYWSQIQNAATFEDDVLNGILKSLVFGVVASWIAVYQGYHSQPTSEGVSRATTNTVVISSLAILGLDFILTGLMFTGE